MENDEYVHAYFTPAPTPIMLRNGNPLDPHVPHHIPYVFVIGNARAALPLKHVTHAGTLDGRRKEPHPWRK